MSQSSSNQAVEGRPSVVDLMEQSENRSVSLPSAASIKSMRRRLRFPRTSDAAVIGRFERTLRLSNVTASNIMEAKTTDRLPFRGCPWMDQHSHLRPSATGSFGLSLPRTTQLARATSGSRLCGSAPGCLQPSVVRIHQASVALGLVPRSRSLHSLIPSTYGSSKAVVVCRIIRRDCLHRASASPRLSIG